MLFGFLQAHGSNGTRRAETETHARYTNCHDSRSTRADRDSSMEAALPSFSTPTVVRRSRDNHQHHLVSPLLASNDDMAAGSISASNDGEVQIKIAGPSEAASFPSHEAPLNDSKHWQWWIMVSVYIFFLIAGQTAATLTARFYYDQDGNSKWMTAFVQTAGFPVLFIAQYLFHAKTVSTQTTIGSLGHLPQISTPQISAPQISAASNLSASITVIYIVLGLFIAADCLMYSYGLLYLPVSTYSLVSASQLAFNAFFSYVLNDQKFSPLILNSVVLVTFSASLLGVDEDSWSANDKSHGKYILGFLLTIGASATYSLILSLMQVTFEKVIKKNTFSVVLNMQIYTALVATLASLVGLFTSGEWKTLEGEMCVFRSGKLSYVMTLLWTAISWQVSSVGVVGLIFVVSSLFSNVIGTLALPIVPVFAVIFFHDKMDGIKIIAMLMAIWGFISYSYQLYVDDKKSRKASISVDQN